MKRIVAAVSLLAWLWAAWPAAGADKPLVVELWPGKAPDEAGGIGPEKVRMSPRHTRKEVEVTEPTRLVTNVSKPTLTIYRPSKDKDTGTAVLICPGGGYWDLYWQLEGEEVAAWLTSQGVTGIILKYRVPRRPDEPKGEPARRPLQDAQRAVSLVRSRAKEWGIDPKRIGMVGFSAGGHLAVATATGFEKRTYEPKDDVDKVSCRPDFAIAAYPGYLKAKDKDELAPGLRVPAGAPPIFLAHGGADIISPPEHSVLMYLALKRAGVPAELHVYAGAAHDFGVRKVDHPCSTWTGRCIDWLGGQGLLKQAKAPPTEALRPWASDRHPQDGARRHTEEISAAKQQYRVTNGGTMDGTNCRSPVGGSFGVWDQSWENNRTVRLENVGETDVVNPWLSNGRNDFRDLKEIVAGALRPGMTDRERAVALWRLQTTHRFHATTGDAEVNDPVKVFNVYGYTTCGDDSVCLAGLWRTAGLKVRPARVVGHCITQVHCDGRWALLDGDMGPFYLLRDNTTIAGERDLVRDHDLLKRAHTHGILDADSRAEAEWSAAMFVYEGEAGGDRDSPRGTTMNMVLRPGEALVWRWGHRVPLKYHGRAAVTAWGKRAADRVCNGLWEYRPDFTRGAWRRGADRAENVRAQDGGLVAEAGKTGVLVWRMRSPYVFVGGRLEVEGAGAKFSLSWDGASWQEVGEDLDALFPAKGPARYEYRLRCELPAGARLQRLAIVNDLQMAPLALPGMVVGENRFTYADQSAGPRRVRLTHEWVERSAFRPPGAPPGPVFPADGGRTDGTDVVFRWRPPEGPEGDGVADYHFELSERPDMAWPLSSNFSKLVSNTADRGRPRYGLPYPGLLAPGRAYYWRARARSEKGVWGPWSKTWSFTPGGPAQPVEVTLGPAKGPDGKVVLRWRPNPAGRKPVKYRVYGSDEKGLSVSDVPYLRNVGQSKELPARAPANFVAETSDTELVVLGAGVELPNANRAFYRVVAVDDRGKRSGPSDYAAAARPFIYSKPPEATRVGKELRYQVRAVRSLGDLRLRVVEGKEVAGFWDVERPRFVLVQGPAWLRIDESTGVLRGVPDAAGSADVVVRVTLERSVRRLDEGRLSWGQELVKEVAVEKTGSATQRFRVRVFAGTAGEAPRRNRTNVERLSPARLAAVHADVRKLQAQRVPVPPLPGLNDYRCVLHAHAEDSAHTGGTLPELLADAKKAGVHAVLLTDHFRPPRDFIDGRWRGLKDGVLFVPGSETHGFLIYPMKSILPRMGLKGKDFIDTVSAGGGMIFLSHIEERKDHPLDGLTGLEIYNRHYDAKRDKASMLALALKLTDPGQLAELEEAVRRYPDELFAFQCDYPKVYLDKWDEGTRHRRLTGVAANDCHHNQVFLVKMVDAETVLIGTGVDQDRQMRKVTAALRPGIKEMTKGRKPGDVLARLDTDPYAVSFRNSATHVLAPRLDEPALRAALRAGHAFVAHDWMGDATGFRFAAEGPRGGQAALMGDEVELADGLKLTAKLPLPAYVRLLRYGKEVAKSDGKAEFEFAVKEAGAYRLEAWLELDGEFRPWVFANPIYVR